MSGGRHFELGELDLSPQVDLIDHILETRLVEVVAPVGDQRRQAPQRVPRNGTGKQAKLHLIEQVETGGDCRLAPADVV